MRRSLLQDSKHVDDDKPERVENKIIDVYERHIDTVYRICFSMTGNRQDAEDIAQTVFITLMESKQRFMSAEHEKAWLIVTAKNKCIDLHRKWWKKKVVQFDSSEMEWFGANTIQHSEIEDTLRKLPSTHRLLLYLHYYEGYKLKEIATMLNINLNTVKTKMRSAKKRLRLEIGDDFHG
ncbi:RNA polymerase sigma factor [Aquibacillus koreensis]|uniref:RNA polymerase sigma factor n=1 Tax=Aquibacillus koreensis TaxID=279446 RepID=A0A9X4AJX4_9BACI|nr:RNA polymerase sigma factor [Aquibacillus koreensis]MCT2535439.1 RNA polymerase sigma factor [Aquibacillus koreensis]MDC3422274.1 RNA polymerase sigma factor [Aquibacillus koreensis]